MILVKLKGILGFCQSQGCWKRSKYEIKITAINEKRYVCEKHFQDVTKVAKITGMTMQNGDEIDNPDEEMDCLCCDLGKERACIDCCRDWDSEDGDY